MPLKIYLLTSELIPFAETGLLAHFSKMVPIKLQEHHNDIRITAPKYGFISERKYILREVIRLREIKSQFDSGEVVASAKSAFIPQTRVQVYFMEHPHWFQPLNPLLYKAKNGRPFPDNDQRFAFFSKIALEMLTHLFWRPDIVLCNSWQSAFVPIIYRQVFAEQDFYKDIKTVQIIHCIDNYSQVSRDTYKKTGVTLPEDMSGDTINSLVVASSFADLVIAMDSPESRTSKELSKNSDFKPIYRSLEERLETIEVEENTPENWFAVADKINSLLQTHFA